MERKEALEIARKLYNNSLFLKKDKEAMVTLIPELKESGDERVSKELIEFLKGSHYKPAKMGRWIVWLEKQDSYYTFEIKKGHWYKCVCDYMPNGSDLIFKHDRLYYCRSDWRLIGEIDERNVKDIGVNGYKSFFRPATNQEIKDWLEQGEQKLAWSEEDEWYIEQLNSLIDGYAVEDDKPNLLKNWLKSLRPQSQWKPSLSQLNALGVVAKGNAPDDIEEINSLYNDLKKLREE